MPVTEQTPVVTHNGNGVTTVFAYNYKILAAADMEVTIDGVVKTLTTDYSVSGVGSDGGGNVTMVAAPASGTANVVLRRDMAYSRSNDYQDNGDLLAVTADEDADRPIMMLQQLVADIARAMKLPVGVPTNQVVAEDAAARVGKLVSFDASGNMSLVVAIDVGLTTVSAFIATLFDDASAAVARTTLGLVIGTDVEAYAASRIQTCWIPASAMVARTTNGAAAGTVETTTNKNMIKTLDFDATTAEFAQFSINMPKGWDEGTVTAAFVWSHAATTTNFGVAWELAGVAVSDDDAMDVAFGTAGTVTDTGGTTNDCYLTAATSAITIAGTPATNDLVMFQVNRAPANGSDTMAIDARLHGVRLMYTINTLTDA